MIGAGHSAAAAAAAQIPYLVSFDPLSLLAEDPLAVLEEHLRAARGATHPTSA